MRRLLLLRHAKSDWDDARRKYVSISPAGIKARDAAFSVIEPILEEAVNAVGKEKVRSALPVIRDLRRQLTGEGKS